MAADDRKPNKNTGIIDALASLFQKKGAAGASAIPGKDGEYEAYIMNTSPALAELDAQREQAKDMTVRFVIALTGESGSVAGKGAAKTIASLEAQTYRHFELTDKPLEAEGDCVVLVRAGDILAPDALYELALFFSRNPDAQLVYADEDSLVDGVRAEPVFKGQYCEATALSYDVFGSPLAVAKRIFDICAAPHPGYAGLPGEAYAFALRCLARAGKAEHIERVLCTRDRPVKPVPCGEGVSAIEYYLKRTGQDCSVSAGLWEGSFRVGARVKHKRTAVIIPNLDGADELRRALESIDETCSFYEPELIIADAGSTGERTKQYYRILEKNGAARIVRNAGTAFCALCNAAARAANTDDFLFLSRDAVLTLPDVIGALRAQAYRRGAGAAGCIINDPSGRLLNTGYAAGLPDGVNSPYAHETPGEDEDLRKLRFTSSIRGVLAVSAVCMLVRADIFHSSGGFDESFDVRGQIMPVGADIEFCIRLMRRGLTNIFTPYASAVLHAPMPRIQDAPEKTRMRCYDALRPSLVAGDPYMGTAWSEKTCHITSGDGSGRKPPEPF